MVGAREVRAPAGRSEPRPRAAEFLRQCRAARRVALGLAVPQAMGQPGRGANAWRPGSKSTPPRRLGRDLSSHRQEPEGRRRLQLHRLLRRTDRPEVQPQRRIRQSHRDQVTLAWISVVLSTLPFSEHGQQDDSNCLEKSRAYAIAHRRYFPWATDESSAATRDSILVDRRRTHWSVL